MPIARRPLPIADAESLGGDDLIALNRLTVVARVLGGTAHDLNNALQIVSGSAEVLSAQRELGEPARRAVQRIQAQTARAAQAISEMLQFARDSGAADAVVSLRDVVARAVAMRGFAIRRAGLVLDFDAASAPPAHVRGSASRLQQAVLNLLINAEQATRGVAGGTISLELTESDGQAVLRIIDSGRGLDPAIEATAFEPFATTRPVEDASGLGLTVARLIARAAGGDVALERRSTGCCATLHVPIAGAPPLSQSG